MIQEDIVRAMAMMSSIAYNMAHEEKLSPEMKEQWLDFWRQFDFFEQMIGD